MGSPACPLIRRFVLVARRDPEAGAILAPDGSPLLRRRELLERSHLLAGELHGHTQPGDTVVLSMPNSWECAAAFIAARWAGLRVALVDATAPKKELERCAAAVGAKALLTGPVGRHWSGSWEAVMRLEPRATQAVPLPPGTAVLKLTSGSTGAPRAVALSIRQVTADAVQILRTMGVGGHDTTLAAIPLTHSYGFGSCLLPLLLAGVPLVFPESHLPAALLAALQGARVTHFPAVPAMIRALAALPELGALPHLRLCLAAGAPLDPKDAAAFQARTGVKVHVFYGSSECGGITFDSSPHAPARKGQVGTPLWRVQVEVVDDHSQPCPPGVEGRVRVTSPAVALGLVPPPAEDNPIVGRRFTTSDVGVLSPDGQLTLTGRAGALLNVAGKKVHPEEIRRVIEALPGVREAVVLGLPDRRRGDLVAAVVAADPAAALTKAAVLAHCRAHLAPYKVPHRLALVEELPRTTRGKVPHDAVVALLGAARK